ncbi:MAG: cytidylyltransferase domain-containing protein [Bryobacteraceae bacterium]
MPSTRDCIAVVPAKRISRRLPDKNVKPFWNDLSLIELKLSVLGHCPSIRRVIVTSDDDRAHQMANSFGAIQHWRSAKLCQDDMKFPDLFAEVLAGYEDAIVYWAHPTSPFVSPRTIEEAFRIVQERDRHCVLGVERLQDFFWGANRRPLNYNPLNQPRSQDLEPIWRVAGGIHVAVGRDFIERGGFAFEPLVMLEMSRTESLDINTGEDWSICQAVAPAVVPAMLDPAEQPARSAL